MAGVLSNFYTSECNSSGASMCHAKSNSWHTWKHCSLQAASYKATQVHASVVDHKRITGRDVCAGNEAICMLATNVAEVL